MSLTCCVEREVVEESCCCSLEMGSFRVELILFDEMKPRKLLIK